MGSPKNVSRVAVTVAASDVESPAVSTIRTSAESLLVDRVVGIDAVLHNEPLEDTACLVLVFSDDETEEATMDQYREIRASYPEMPIMVVSQHGGTAFIEEVLSDAASEFVSLSGPVPVGLLSARIRTLVATTGG
jgi:DNA-binding NarL/FixJ family response regulator